MLWPRTPRDFAALTLLIGIVAVIALFIIGPQDSKTGGAPTAPEKAPEPAPARETMASPSESLFDRPVEKQPASPESQPTKTWKAHELTPEEEKRWIETVKNHKTGDGKTVMEVLKYAEKMRPKKFKLAEIEAVYDGGSGEPDGVAISYFIGMKRQHDDEYSVIYGVKRTGNGIELDIAESAKALEGGQDSFLIWIDDEYENVYTEPQTDAKPADEAECDELTGRLIQATGATREHRRKSYFSDIRQLIDLRFGAKGFIPRLFP